MCLVLSVHRILLVCCFITFIGLHLGQEIRGGTEVRQLSQSASQSLSLPSVHQLADQPARQFNQSGCQDIRVLGILHVVQPRLSARASVGQTALKPASPSVFLSVSQPVYQPVFWPNGPLYYFSANAISSKKLSPASATKLVTCVHICTHTWIQDILCSDGSLYFPFIVLIIPCNHIHFCDYLVYVLFSARL